jgi:tetratricopeptide (TPR) repeat protein
MRKIPGFVALALAASMCCASMSMGAGLVTTRAADVGWTGSAVNGAQVRIPAGDRPSVVLFYRAAQRQSDDALQQLMRSKPEGVQTVVVTSGPQAADHARTLAAQQPELAVVADPDYAISGRLDVHAWPTTVVINDKGDELAHIGGISKSYSLEVAAYSDYAAGRLDRAALEKRLGDRGVVADNAAQAAARHLQVAQKMLSRGKFEEAETEINAGLRLNPESAPLRLAQVRVLVQKGNAEEARKVLESVQPGSVAQYQLQLARGRVMLASGDASGAAEQFEQALKLNPDPAETYYELGLAHQKSNQWQQAAESFRKAFEATH